MKKNNTAPVCEKNNNIDVVLCDINILHDTNDVTSSAKRRRIEDNAPKVKQGDYLDSKSS